jgi:hypothetical protein
VVFQHENASLIEPKWTKEAFNAVRVTVCSICLHLTMNNSGFNRIEQIWWMGKGSINREHDNILANPPYKHMCLEIPSQLLVILMVESYFIRLRAIFVLMGQCLNGFCDIRNDA